MEVQVQTHRHAALLVLRRAAVGRGRVVPACAMADRPPLSGEIAVLSDVRARREKKENPWERRSG